MVADRQDDYEAAVKAVADAHAAASQASQTNVFAYAGTASGDSEGEPIWPLDWERRDRPCDITVGDLIVHIPAMGESRLT